MAGAREKIDLFRFNAFPARGRELRVVSSCNGIWSDAEQLKKFEWTGKAFRGRAPNGNRIKTSFASLKVPVLQRNIFACADSSVQ